MSLNVWPQLPFVHWFEFQVVASVVGILASCYQFINNKSSQIIQIPKWYARLWAVYIIPDSRNGAVTQAGLIRDFELTSRPLYINSGILMRADMNCDLSKYNMFTLINIRKNKNKKSCLFTNPQIHAIAHMNTDG